MVSRVWGKADGIEIMLEKGEEGRWTGLLPQSEDGEYIVELYAEDLAGNIGYYCTMLFAISGHTMRGHVVSRGYTANKQTCDFGNVIEKIEFVSKIKKGGYKIVRSVCSADAHGHRGSDSC